MIHWIKDKMTGIVWQTYQFCEANIILSTALVKKSGNYGASIRGNAPRCVPTARPFRKTNATSNS